MDILVRIVKGKEDEHRENSRRLIELFALIIMIGFTCVVVATALFSGGVLVYYEPNVVIFIFEVIIGVFSICVGIRMTIDRLNKINHLNL